MNWLRTKRIKYAFKMGKLEHKFGRLIAIPIIISMFWSYQTGDKYNLLFTSLTFVCWLIYLGSHRLEKWLFGTNGPRSGWGKKK